MTFFSSNTHLWLTVVQSIILIIPARCHISFFRCLFVVDHNSVLFFFYSHFAAECTSQTVCWNCKESGHIASECKNEALCHTCNKTGHLARDCPTSGANVKLCNKCFKPGHIAVDCTNERACNNCRQPGHIARECKNDPVCNLCNVSGHVARVCPKTTLASEIQGGPFRDILCRICGQPGHISRNCIATIICDTCGGRGHMSYECPSARIFNRGLRRLWELFADGLCFVTMVEFRLDPGCFICFWQYWNSFPSAMVVEGRFCRMCCGWNSFFPFNQDI